MEARCSGRCRDSASSARTWYANANSKCPAGSSADPLAENIRPDIRSIALEWFGSSRISTIRRPSWSHLHAVRRLRQLRGPGSFSTAHRVRHCWPFWWVVCSLTLGSSPSSLYRLHLTVTFEPFSLGLERRTGHSSYYRLSLLILLL